MLAARVARAMWEEAFPAGEGSGVRRARAAP
jgi:hypothetical protein